MLLLELESFHSIQHFLTMPSVHIRGVMKYRLHFHLSRLAKRPTEGQQELPLIGRLD